MLTHIHTHTHKLPDNPFIGLVSQVKQRERRFIEHLLSAIWCTQTFIRMTSFSPCNSPMSQGPLYPHFIDEKTEAERGVDLPKVNGRARVQPQVCDSHSCGPGYLDLSAITSGSSTWQLSEWSTLFCVLGGGFVYLFVFWFF